MLNDLLTLQYPCLEHGLAFAAMSLDSVDPNTGNAVQSNWSRYVILQSMYPGKKDSEYPPRRSVKYAELEPAEVSSNHNHHLHR